MPVVIQKVLICDPVDNACVNLLSENGIQADFKGKLSKDQLISIVKDYNAVIVRSETKITEDILQAGAAGNLKVVGRAGAGVDNINVEAATKNNIIVLNTPGGNAIAACELTCMLIGSLARPIVAAGASMKDGRWDRKLYSGTELMGKTLAILGLGRIGREVAVRMNVWGMTLIGFDPIVTAEDAKSFNVQKMELNEIWPLADYITVHTPLIPQTKNLISSETLAKCKKGVKVVNVARGGIIEEVALLEALESGQCGGAALDVFPEEPPTSEVTKKLIQHAKVVATPHLGASTSEAQVRVAVEVSEQIIALTGTSSKYTKYLGVVNPDVLKSLNF
jgi:D-3-phosphoglycerate dehydrogenase